MGHCHIRTKWPKKKQSPIPVNARWGLNHTYALPLVWVEATILNFMLFFLQIRTDLSRT